MLEIKVSAACLNSGKLLTVTLPLIWIDRAGNCMIAAGSVLSNSLDLNVSRNHLIISAVWTR